MSNSEPSKNLKYYRDCFSQINVYKNTKKGGEALNQPILLLTVIDLIAQGIITENRILPSDEVIENFKKYWELLATEPFKNSDFALPFFHLKNTSDRKDKNRKFWYLKFSSEYDGGRPQTINTLRQAVDYAYLAQDLFDFLQDRESRGELLDNLISSWFSSQNKKLESILQINQDFNQVEEEEEVATKDNVRFYFKKSAVRDAFFRKSIVHVYDYRCAFCRLRVKKAISQSIVDGAHIKPFSQFYDNKISNGIAFCKNHHWAFDRGWFSLSEQYKILVSEDLEEDSPYSRPIKEFHGEVILLPSGEAYYPSLEALNWHRNNIFMK